MGGRLAGFMVSRLRSRTSTPPKGVRTTFACAAFADWVPDYDASVVERMMEAGAIIVGKLNFVNKSIVFSHSLNARGRSIASGETEVVSPAKHKRDNAEAIFS